MRESLGAGMSSRGRPWPSSWPTSACLSARARVASWSCRWWGRRSAVVKQEVQKLSCYEFGRQLILTKDLDPVYVLLHHSKLGTTFPAMLHRWLMAYWCFYHVGTASWITYEGMGYWERMEQAASSKNYPRSPERRHFRGQNAIKSVAYLKYRGLTALFRD